jgi:hypothetical protein
MPPDRINALPPPPQPLQICVLDTNKQHDPRGMFCSSPQLHTVFAALQHACTSATMVSPECLHTTAYHFYPGSSESDGELAHQQSPNPS